MHASSPLWDNISNAFSSGDPATIAAAIVVIVAAIWLMDKVSPPPKDHE